MGWFKAKANPAVPADTKIDPPFPNPYHPTDANSKFTKLRSEQSAT